MSATLGSRRTVVRRGLLWFGLVAPVYYVVVDGLLVSRYEGYRFADHTVSELFAIGAPTAALAVPLMLVYSVMAIAFGCGVWLSAGGRRAVRVVAVALVVKEVLGIVGTAFGPMHMRGVEPTFTDTLHITVTALGALCYLVAMGFGAAAFGRAFRFYSIGTVAVLVVGGFMAGRGAGNVPSDLPTPWMGLWERLNIYATMLWIVVLAVLLLRSHRSHRTCR
ncbi:DUF998 domain-containing protein [Saccharothrix sp. NPDC042600]|uniref:DUF998 domain-containing protein n=1 Tax=Saccharothrix TaxID=2071 RepID=UPI0033F8B654